MNGEDSAVTQDLKEQHRIISNILKNIYMQGKLLILYIDTVYKKKYLLHPVWFIFATTSKLLKMHYTYRE